MGCSSSQTNTKVILIEQTKDLISRAVLAKSENSMQEALTIYDQAKENLTKLINHKPSELLARREIIKILLDKAPKKERLLLKDDISY